MCLCGILKNILLVVASVMIWTTPISFLQFLGYGIALAGLVYYSLGWDQIVDFSTGFWAFVKSLWDSPSLDERLPAAVRRGLSLGLTVLIMIALSVWYVYGDASVDAATAAKAAVS